MSRVTHGFAVMSCVSALAACGGGGDSVGVGGQTTSTTDASVSSGTSSSATSSSSTGGGGGGGGGSGGGAGTSSSSAGSGSSTGVGGGPVVTDFDSLLPAEPKLPSVVCSTLSATRQQTGGRLPDALDADPANSQPDRKILQETINACPPGQAVKLVTSGANNAFLAGRLTLKSGVTLWVDAGVTVFASRSPLDYDNGTGNCGDALSSGGSACIAWITASGTVGSGIVGDGTLDGRGGSVMTSGHRANLMTWWDLAMQSKASPALDQNNPRMLQVSGGSGFTLYRINIQNSPKFHVVTSGVKGFTAWGVKLLTPSLAYANPGYTCAAGTFPTPTKTMVPSTCFYPEVVKNTDGFDPGTSSDVTLAYSYISTGDDNVAIKSSGAPVSTNQLYGHNHFYYGHGMSIGSETDAGVDNIKVWDLATDGHDGNGVVGLRIKSDGTKGGEVKNVVYKSVCARRTKDAMVFDPYYSSVSTFASAPNFHDITISGYHYVNFPGSAYNSGKVTFNGYSSNNIIHPLEMRLDNVVFDDAPTVVTSAHNGGPPPVSNAQFTFGPGPVSFTMPVGATVKITDERTETPPPIDCSAAFEAFPSPASPF